MGEIAKKGQISAISIGNTNLSLCVNCCVWTVNLICFTDTEKKSRNKIYMLTVVMFRLCVILTIVFFWISKYIYCYILLF